MFSATPASGAAPLAVRFYYNLGSSNADAIDFGDGSPAYIFGNDPPYTITKDCSSDNCAVSHTYNSVGKYKASLIYVCLNEESCGSIPDRVFATTTVGVI